MYSPYSAKKRKKKKILHVFIPSKEFYTYSFKGNVNEHNKTPVKNNLLWGLITKKFVWIHEETENIDIKLPTVSTTL